MTTGSRRIDVHQHIIPPFYRDLLAKEGITEAGGRTLPAWSPGAALDVMDLLGVASAVVSVSTPGVGFLSHPDEVTDLACRLNDYSAALVADHPGRFGYVATLPMPDIGACVTEARRALDDLGADGVTLLANNQGVYLGAAGQDELWHTLNERGAVVFVHPSELPSPAVPRIPPFAADFLLDTTRAAFLLVRNGVVRAYPKIRFILSHAGGFVPYASHRMAVGIAGDTGRSTLDVLDDFRAFYFDTALSSSPAALPTLLAFARPGHILFGSDWPFAPAAVSQYFAAGLDRDLDPATLAAVHHGNAAALFRHDAVAPARPAPVRLRHALQRSAARLVFSLMQP